MYVIDIETPASADRVLPVEYREVLRTADRSQAWTAAKSARGQLTLLQTVAVRWIDPVRGVMPLALARWGRND